MKIFLTCVVILALMTWALACGGGVEGATMVKDDRLDTDEFQDYRVFVVGDNEPSGFSGVPASGSVLLTIQGDAIRVHASERSGYVRESTECGGSTPVKVRNNQTVTFATCKPGASSDVILSYDGKEYYRTRVVTPKQTPTRTPQPTPTTTPSTNTGAWHTWEELKEPLSTGPHIFLDATDHTGKRVFGLQIACWPTNEGDLDDRRLAVFLTEIFQDPDTIAAMRLASLSTGYYPIGVSIDGESLGSHGWLVDYGEGPVDAYYFAELFIATIEVSEEIIAALASPGANEMVANVNAAGVEDTRKFDVRGAGEALKPVLEVCPD